MSLNRASAKGDLASVKKLVQEGANVNTADSSGRTPLIEAAWGGNSEVAKFLVEKGADVNAMDKAGFTALMRTAEEGHTPVATLLIQKGANVNARGKVRGTTALMLAAEKGHVKILEALITGGAKVNAVDQYEETALARAYRTSQKKASEFLESKGGRGKPERSSYSSSDRDSHGSSKTSAPQWNAGSFDSGSEEEGSAGGAPFEEDM